MYCRGLLLRQRNAAFAVSYPNKDRQDHSVIGSREFRKIESIDRRETSVKPQSFDRIDVAANLGFEESARLDIRIARDTEEQQFQGPGPIQRQRGFFVPKEPPPPARQFPRP